MASPRLLPAELQEHLLLRPEQHEAPDVRLFSRCDLFIWMSNVFSSWIELSGTGVLAVPFTDVCQWCHLSSLVLNMTWPYVRPWARAMRDPTGTDINSRRWEIEPFSTELSRYAWHVCGLKRNKTFPELIIQDYKILFNEKQLDASHSRLHLSAWFQKSNHYIAK